MLRDLAVGVLVACVLGVLVGCVVQWAEPQVYRAEELQAGGGNPGARTWVLEAEAATERALLRVDGQLQAWARRR